MNSPTYEGDVAKGLVYPLGDSLFGESETIRSLLLPSQLTGNERIVHEIRSDYWAKG